MLKVKRIEALRGYGFDYITKFRNGSMYYESYQYKMGNLVLAYMDASTYPALVLKNYAYNQDFVERVFPQMIKDGVVEYEEEEEKTCTITAS